MKGKCWGLAILAVLLSVSFLGAGGPGVVWLPGQPFHWNQAGTLTYLIDSDRLGAFSQEEARLLIEEGFRTWTGIEGGYLNTRFNGFLEKDIRGDNYNSLFETVPSDSFVVFDQGGELLDDYLGEGSSNWLYGFSEIRYLDSKTQSLRSGWVILNSGGIPQHLLQRVIHHELGHLLGLDHTQGASRLAASRGEAIQLPIMYPYITEQTASRPLADDEAWFRWLYPQEDAGAPGQIKGFVRGADGTPVFGANVVAIPLVRNGDGGWDPALQDSIAVTSDFLRESNGEFLLPNLDPGAYLVFMETLDDRFKGASAVGGYSGAVADFPSEFYSGSLESGTDLDDPLAAEIVMVESGSRHDIQLVPNRTATRLIIPSRSGALREENTFVGAAIVNPTGKSDWIRLYSSSETSGAELVDSMELPDRSQSVFMADEVSGQLNASALLAESQEGPIRGLSMWGDFSRTRLDALNPHPAEATELFFLPVEASGLHQSYFYLINGNPEEATLQIDFLDRSGLRKDRVALVLKPQASAQKSLSELFGALERGSSGYLRVRSDLPIRGFQTVESDTAYVGFTSVIPMRTSRLISPHFFWTPSADTRLTLLNSGDSSAVLEVIAFDDRGARVGAADLVIGAGEIFSEELSRLIPSSRGTLQGYLEVRPSEPDTGMPMLSGNVLFHGRNFAASLPLRSNGNRHTLFPYVAQSRELGMYTGLAIVNPGRRSAAVELSVFDEAGVLRESVNFEVQPGARIIDLLDGKAFFGAEFKQVKGHVRMKSSQPVTAFSLFGDYGQECLAALEGQHIEHVQ